MSVNLTDPKFHDENAAREWFKSSRWPDCQLSNWEEFLV
jgi:hypothetical protein